MTAFPSPRPLSILCELTYRCNLQCPYCYNPLTLREYAAELTPGEWRRVLKEAAELGVVQAHFSGGEPTLFAGLPALIAEASELGLYTNLITQGTFLEKSLFAELLEAGLDHVQVSIQGPEADLADRIAGADVHAKKIENLGRIRESNVALTLNCVLHRANHDTLESIVALAERLGIKRLELANVQFYGWAYRNRSALMPTREQVRSGAAVVASARERLRGRMEIVYVLPDYFGEFPKPCMNGWGSTFITVVPTGEVLPCPAAAAIASIEFESVRDRSLRDIWYRSPAFQRFRGTKWMPDPCRTCARREIDWGGCRCQAFLLTGDAGVTDPACSLSPHHPRIVALQEGAEVPALVPRRR